jgi:hypothetical protein
MSRRVFSFCFVAAMMSPTIAFSQSFLSQYKGLPYHDSRYSGGPQKIPGKVLCAYYDLGRRRSRVSRHRSKESRQRRVESG